MNKIDLRMSAKIENEPFSRTVIAAFAMALNPTLDEIIEIKTIVSEAVSNAIIHGYNYDETKFVYLKAQILDNGEMEIIVQDYGVGIENVEQAQAACYTSRPDLERSGMGFTIMQSLSDAFFIQSVVGLGTKLTIRKVFANVRSEVK